MTDNKMTPEEIVEKWLPDFKERYLNYYEVDIDDDLSLDYQLEYPDWIRKHFPEALEAFWENEKMNNEWMIHELKGRIESIKRATPYSFKSLTEEDKAERHYLASCKCGWWGSSALLEGGGAIADTGDYFDCTCPFCGSADIGEMNDPYCEVWDQACRKQREECQKYFDMAIERGKNLGYVIPIEVMMFSNPPAFIEDAPVPEFKLTEKE